MDREEKQMDQLQQETLNGASDELQAPDDRATATHATTGTHSSCTLKGITKKSAQYAVIVVVWMVLTIPLVMYYVPQVIYYSP